MPDIMDADPVVVHPGKYLFVVVSTCARGSYCVSSKGLRALLDFGFRLL